jgi:hypothetical protein
MVAAAGKAASGQAMTFRAADLSNFIGTKVLPFTNPRVVSPPGVPGRHGRVNLIVATPMRSGTHILIDLLLNNLPAYRHRPLYIDLDQCLKQARPGHDLLGRLAPDAGHVVKTHYPIAVPEAAADPRLPGLLRAGLVLAIHRPRAEILRSLDRWQGAPEDSPEARFGPQIDAFWAHWKDIPRIDLEFAELFDAGRMRALLERIAAASGAPVAPRFVPPPGRGERRRIYLDKALTRALGRHAPRINTTIHTLKD